MRRRLRSLLLERMPANQARRSRAPSWRSSSTPARASRPAGHIDREGMATVLALRSRYAEPRKTLDSIDPYIDLSFFDRVTGR